ncbi:MAG: alcohol dehydrogenase catalytic domain-containing protein, partial [Phycisphaeraceae bacterium]|nr:alcohol dehydrogenase catalytic domain-containing protein [Phycisphaeraceae bacterium]
MRGLVFDGQQPTLVSNLPDPTPPKGEAVIRPTRMGICSTDLELCKGYMGYKGVLGHEFVGLVEQVSSASEKAWIGKRVVGNINCPCGACDMCK